MSRENRKNTSRNHAERQAVSLVLSVKGFDYERLTKSKPRYFRGCQEQQYSDLYVNLNDQ